ncbi:MAG: hypothetical protein O7G31_10820, partial [Calditrichaeota bacterium]|nr:hypothetical protein [Calditrichota bacterium]
MKHLWFILCVSIVLVTACEVEIETGTSEKTPEPEYFLTQEQTHNKFSSAIPPVLTVPSGAIIEAKTEEASDRQLDINSTAADV